MRQLRAGRARIAQLVERLFGLPLRWQIGTLVVVGLIVIFALFGLLGSAIATDAKQRTLNDWLGIATSSATFLDAELEGRYERLERVSLLAGNAAADPARSQQLLQDAFDGTTSQPTAVVLLGADGRVLASSDTLALREYLATHRELFDRIHGAARQVSPVTRVDGRAAIILAVPVYAADRQPSGILAELVPADVFRDVVASARGIAHTGHAQLVDQTDHVIASSDPNDVIGPGEHPDIYEPLLAGRQAGVRISAPVGPSDPMDQGQRHDMAFVSLRNAPWGLALGGSDAELTADASRWQQQIVLFGGASILLAILLVGLTTRGVSRPILALASASRKIAGGDLTTPIPRGGEGEVRVLAQAFDDMRQALRTALSDLALEKSRYEGIVTSMADAVVTTDADLRITAFNPSAVALTGRQAAAALQHTYCEVLCSTDGTPSTCGRTCPLTAEDSGVSKASLRRLDGTVVSVATTHAVIRDSSGRVAGSVHVLRDISAEAEVDRLKEEFLSTVSHELRTPLGFIMGYATSLLLPDAPDDRSTTRRMVKVIADASKELEELVDNLLDMTKIGAGSLSVSPTATPLGPLARAAASRIRVRATAHRFVVNVPSSLPVIQADARRIEQVLYNLLDNAIKYSPDGGTITISAQAEDRAVQVTVTDSGIGIPPPELARIFERFHRGEPSRVRGIAGSGLGLTICKGIVEAHGGRIWAESPVGDRTPGAPPGSAFHFTVPT